MVAGWEGGRKDATSRKKDKRRERGKGEKKGRKGRTKNKEVHTESKKSPKKSLKEEKSDEMSSRNFASGRKVRQHSKRANGREKDADMNSQAGRLPGPPPPVTAWKSSSWQEL